MTKIDASAGRVEENLASFANLESNLRLQNMTLEGMPYMLQFNKRDLPNVAPEHYLDFLLNQREVRVPARTAIATDGTGVFETLNIIAKMVLGDFMKKNNLSSSAPVAGELAVSER